MEITTVPINYINSVVNAAVLRGCDADKILNHCGIAPELLHQDKARVPATTFSKLSDTISAELRDESGGFMDQRTKPGTFAMMCYACIHCNTLGEFLERSTKFNYLVTDCVDLRVERKGDIASYIVTPGLGTIDPDNFFTHILLSLAHRLSNWLIKQCLVLESVNFTHARPHYANEYNFLFGAPIHFERFQNKLVFSSNYLDLPLRQDEQALEEFLKLPAVHLMSSPDAGNSFVAKVKDMIQDSISEQCPEFEDIASNLHTTSVTLRRRLREEGTSYQQIKDDIRRDTAVFNLSRGTMTIESVAASVGFSETTSFFRAFKRWTGVTPRAYIKRNTAG
jgi:AraC-like DNA-binding protein